MPVAPLLDRGTSDLNTRQKRSTLWCFQWDIWKPTSIPQHKQVKIPHGDRGPPGTVEPSELRMACFQHCLAPFLAWGETWGLFRAPTSCASPHRYFLYGISMWGSQHHCKEDSSMKQTRKIGRDCCKSRRGDFADHLNQIPGSAACGYESLRQTLLEWD